MNYTPNYQLPQWVESDRVLMSDFNSANSKIDAALKTLAGKSAWTKLASLTTTTEAQSVSLNVPTAKIVQQQLVLIRATVPQIRAYLTINNGGYRCSLMNGGYREYNGVVEVNVNDPAWVLFPIGKNGSGKMQGLSIGLSFYYAYCDTIPSNWTTMGLTSIYSDKNLPIGTSMELWGCY